MRGRILTLTLCFLIAMMIPGCNKHKTPCACGIENPQENIDWLKYLLSRVFCVEVYTVIYDNEEYIGIHDCPRIVDGMTVIYDCSGNKVCEFGGVLLGSGCSLPDFWTNFEKNKNLIYIQDIQP